MSTLLIKGRSMRSSTPATAALRKRARKRPKFSRVCLTPQTKLKPRPPVTTLPPRFIRRRDTLRRSIVSNSPLSFSWRISPLKCGKRLLRPGTCLPEDLRFQSRASVR
jgi:hypothetical protein